MINQFRASYTMFTATNIAEAKVALRQISMNSGTEINENCEKDIGFLKSKVGEIANEIYGDIQFRKHEKHICIEKFINILSF